MRKPSRIEAERQRLARRINEDIVQSLRLLQVQTETYRRVLSGHPDTRVALDVLAEMMRQIMQRAHHLRDNLHPSVLETLGLEPALEALATQVRQTRGLHITLQSPRLHHRLAYPAEVAIYHTIQSLIDYASMHNGALNFNMQLIAQSNGVALHYEDDGIWMPSRMTMLHDLRADLETVGGTFTEYLTDASHLEVKLYVAYPEEMPLTEREREVLECVAEGLTNKQIANRLNLSTRTISFHLDNSYTKLGARTRTEAVMIALSKAWIENPSA